MINLPDERSAAFLAIGIAQWEARPVGILCSSGTAGLNYAPALAEAFYQKLPLIAMTADRPPERIDQMDGQTIRQPGMFHNHVKREAQLPYEPRDQDSLRVNRHSVLELLNEAMNPPQGPVHLNIPLEEPLYGLEAVSRDQKEEPGPGHDPGEVPTIGAKDRIARFNRAKKVMVIAGMLRNADPVRDQLEKWALSYNVVVLTETPSGLRKGAFVNCIDRVLLAFPEEQRGDVMPDLLITLGGPVISKKIKQLLQAHPPDEHWHIGAEPSPPDTYRCLSWYYPGPPAHFFEHMENGIEPRPVDLKAQWDWRSQVAQENHEAFLARAPFSDLKVFEAILEHLPRSSIVHMGNSSPARYFQLFEGRYDLEYYGNRGTSGIDGTVSTATGMAKRTETPLTLVIGDIGLLYDANGFWVRDLPGNLSVIVINNGGGGIFRIIDGPSEQPELAEHFEAGHTFTFEGVAQTYGLAHASARDLNELESALEWLYGEMKDQPAMLEVHTPRESNAGVLRDYFGTKL